MNWKKLLLTAALVGTAVLAFSGCNSMKVPTSATENPASTTEQSVATTEQPTSTSNSTIPQTPEDMRMAPPEGGVLGERPSAPAMDLAAAAEKLGVTEEQLSEALGDMQQVFQDLAAVAAKLGVSEDSLREALGLPEGGPPNGGPPQGEFPQGGPPPAGPEPTTQG